MVANISSCYNLITNYEGESWVGNAPSHERTLNEMNSFIQSLASVWWNRRQYEKKSF